MKTVIEIPRKRLGKCFDNIKRKLWNQVYDYPHKSITEQVRRQVAVQIHQTIKETLNETTQ